MDIPKTNPAVKFLLSESDEFIARKKKLKKNEESVIVSKDESDNSIYTLLEAQDAPKLPDIEAIRNKIANNEYKINYDALAEKMLQLENLWLD